MPALRVWGKGLTKIKVSTEAKRNSEIKVSNFTILLSMQELRDKSSPGYVSKKLNLSWHQKL